jgi:effector-binding domain-containing protein
VPSSHSVAIVDLRVIEVASVIHRGTMEGIAPAFESLIRWVDDSGYQVVGPVRELYHEWHDEDPTLHVTELQVPVAESPAG